jgi:hypothetical protein
MLECSAEYHYPLWEAAWMFSTKKKVRGEQTLRMLIKNELVAPYRTKSWKEEIVTPLTAKEQKHVLETLHHHG